MWVRGTGYGNTPQLLGVLQSDSPAGPFTFFGNRSGTDDPFNTIAPGIANFPSGYQYADATLFQDPHTLKTYVYWRSRLDTGANGPTGFRAMELTDDCLAVKEASDTRVFRTPNREAPAVFHHDGTFYLWTSGTMGWEPTDTFLYAASSPLGNFSASSDPGHGWHTYTKAGKGSRHDGGAWGLEVSTAAPQWTVRDGYLPQGNVWGKVEKVTTTLPAALRTCGDAQGCEGFCFQDWDRAPPPDRTLVVAFKTAAHFVPEDPAAGIQPPPIPPPNRPGNTAPAQPGRWAFDSQSTYVLPNPAYTAGSRLPQFVFMADRWSYSPEHGTSRATYVWLPLFIDPKNPRKVTVVWYDEWRLDNVTSPFV